MFISRHTIGKQPGQHLVAQVAGPHQSHLLYVCDCDTGLKFLVDTGAQVSVFPATPQERRVQKTEPLIAANSSSIDTFGTKTISLDLGFRKFQWPFLLANVHRPILGADFFCSNHLLIDVFTNHIIDGKHWPEHLCQREISGQCRNRTRKVDGFGVDQQPAPLGAGLVVSRLCVLKWTWRSASFGFFSKLGVIPANSRRTRWWLLWGWYSRVDTSWVLLSGYDSVGFAC